MQSNQLQHLSTKNNLPQRLEDTPSVLPMLLDPEFNKDSIVKIQKIVNFEIILSDQNTELPLIQAARIDEDSVLKVIYLQTYEFIAINFPDTDKENVAEMFSRDVLAVNGTWTILDVLHFFKWIRQSQGSKDLKILGNKINALNLMYLVSIYNESRITAHEEKLRQEQAANSVVNQYIKTANASVPGARVKELRERLHRKEIDHVEYNRQYGKIIRDMDEDRPAPNATLANLSLELAEKLKVTEAKLEEEKRKAAELTRRYHKENEFCLQWIKALYYINADGTKILGRDRITWFAVFRTRKAIPLEKRPEKYETIWKELNKKV